MPSGIQATVEFTEAGRCPIASLSADASTTIDSVAVNVCPTPSTESVSEFSMDGDPDLHDSHDPIVPIFSHGSTRRYRLVHEGGVTCPCECLGAHGCPVARYEATAGTLTLAFYAADFEQLQTVVADLRERFPDVDIKRFVRTPTGEASTDDVLVDRGRLTPRQLEVLRAAYERGYYERPRRANATEIASALGINPSTFSEHLAAAESKLLGDVLEEGP